MRRSGSPVAKPLTDLGGQPLALHLARYLHGQGCQPILFALGHQAPAVATELRRLDREHPELGLQWRDTGSSTGNGGRLLRLGTQLPCSSFLMCWCDGLSDLDLPAMLAFHYAHGRLATVAAVREPARFGVLELDHDRVSAFREKDSADRRWINGGFFMLEPAAVDFVHDPGEAWESGPMQRLIAADQLRAYRHNGFWAALDSTVDRDQLARRMSATDSPWQTA